MFCTEARLTNDICEKEYEIDGYNAVVCLSQSRFTGGVVIYVKKTLKYKVIENASLEKMLWYLTIEIFDCEINGVYSVLYRSPAHIFALTYAHLDAFFEKIVRLNKLNVITCDMNVDMNLSSNNTRYINDLLEKHGIKQIVKFATRHTNETQTLIDYVITNSNDRVSCKPLSSENITDHETIEIKITINTCEKGTPERVLSWSNYDKYQMIANLMKCDWSTFNVSCIDNKLDILRSNLEWSVSPLTKIVQINNVMKPKKWFDPELRSMKFSKTNKYNKWRSHKCEENWNEYLESRNSYNRMIKQKKNDYTRNQIYYAGNNQRLMWKHLNNLVSNKTNKTSDEIIFDNIGFTEPAIISEKFNKYFVDSIMDLNQRIPQMDDRSNDEQLQLQKCFKFEQTNIDEVGRVLLFLTKKINKSELCNSQIWYDAFDYCGYFLTQIVNESLETGYFPKTWKIATVVPIPKIANTKNAAEHRGINMLPIDEKVIEIIVKNQLVRYIEDNKILSQHQSAFRTKHSCESTINYIINDWKTAIENGQSIVVVFLDLKRAFETIDRRILLNRLKSIGIKDTELDWFTSYMDARKQQTKFKSATSSELDIDIGVPQGTALSVILFNLYINNITKIPVHAQVVLFADDAGLIIKDTNVNSAIQKMNQDLILINNWLNSNKLTLNVNKTKWMLVNRNDTADTNLPVVKIENEIIEKVSTIKYLGIQIDDKLSFKEQVTICNRKAACKTNMLYRISKKLTFDTRKVIYNSFIQPQFQYCSTIYINCNKEDIEKLQLIQNRAMRIVLNCEYLTPSVFMIRALNWLSISQQIKFNVAIYVYKMLNGLLPSYLYENCIFTRDIHHRTTRLASTNALRMPNFRLEFSRKSLFYNGVKLFNELPNDIKNSQSLSIFKSKCRTYISENFEI